MENQNNDILKKLMAEMPLEKAPAGFTEKLMQRLQKEEKPSSAWDISGFLSPQYWLLIGAALGAALIFLFSYDLPLFSWLFENADLNTLSSILGSILIQAKSYFVSLNFSSISIAIFASIGLLFLLERVLRRRLPSDCFPSDYA